jgi:formyl-CoA transferase
MNLSHPDGQSVFKELVKDADVLVENFRPGTLERWGISPAALHEINPGLVIVRTTGFGQDGPYASRPGFGTLAEAMSGFAYINGWPDKPPALPPFALGDGVAALAGTFSAMFALWWRDHGGNGRGQVVDLAIYEPLFWILGPQASVYDQLGEVQGRSGNSTPFSAPRNVYRASDGKWLALSASTQSIAERVMRIIGREDYLAEPWFVDHAGRLAHVEELDAAIQDWVGRHTSAEVLGAFSAGEGAIARVYSIQDIVEDPQFLARHSLVRVPHPQLGSILMQNMIARLSVTPGSVRGAGAALGEHNREVLGSLGLTEEDLAHLAEAGVIAMPAPGEQVQPSSEGLAI